MFRNPVQRATLLTRLLRDHLTRAGSLQSHLHTSAACRDALAASEAWNFSPRDACLSGTRGVLRLGGTDVIHFLQACTRPLAPQYVLVAGQMATSGLACPGALTSRSCAQGLLTNDVEALATADGKPLYASILNAQGRVLHDMFLYRQPGKHCPVALSMARTEAL